MNGGTSDQYAEIDEDPQPREYPVAEGDDYSDTAQMHRGRRGGPSRGGDPVAEEEPEPRDYPVAAGGDYSDTAEMHRERRDDNGSER